MVIESLKDLKIYRDRPGSGWMARMTFFFPREFFGVGYFSIFGYFSERFYCKFTVKVDPGQIEKKNQPGPTKGHYSLPVAQLSIIHRIFFRSSKFEVRTSKSEVRSPKSEVRSSKFEFRSSKFEVRVPKSEVR